MKTLRLSVLMISALIMGLSIYAEDPLDVGSRLEPLIDNWLIGSLENTALKLHHPVMRDAAITYDAPWEGNTSCYVTVFMDDDCMRMYYRGANYDLETKKSSGEKVCYAESKDGIHWEKPALGLFESAGTKENNIVWRGPGTHNFTPFRDMNPDCPPDARYKAVVSGKDHAKLIPLKSADAIHWELIQEEPVITEGAFDSQNLAFYDVYRNRYVEFHRGFTDGVRAIMTGTSDDFLHWSKPVWLDYGGIPAEHLYTNAITAWPGAPHIFVGFPKRFVPDRDLKVHPNPGVSDGVFMTSRDGVHFKRWREALIRPGIQKSRWVNRNNMTAWGILTTPSHLPDAPDEWSIYSTEGYYVGPCILRRHTIRQQGFVSVNAPGDGGTMTTKALRFAKNPDGATALHINYSTSAAGTIRCEIRDAAGKAIPGYSLDECDAIFGDHLDRQVTWKGNADLSALADQPVILYFQLADADLYTIQFR